MARHMFDIVPCGRKDLAPLPPIAIAFQKSIDSDGAYWQVVWSDGGLILRAWADREHSAVRHFIEDLLRPAANQDKER